ncbi:hypothetical protein [Nocardia pneumoniae]|uniref:hypothetical protein n=1 Tax=Nocardia pneumoniae TaxID=228601 RepID=UPI0002FE662E|nr:hypothetical protein [Nocardia pneumoniae]
MVAESVVTLGVSTERGAVYAVALADGEKLADRVLLRRVGRTDGDSTADVAASVEAVLNAVAAGLGSDREIGGVAVAYRDAAERRAIVTRLATGPWHSASMVSAKSAHLSVAGMLTSLDIFDNLLVCEVVPGYQAFTLVDRGRRRVLAAVGRAGRTTPQSLRGAVTAAWEQLEAAATRPDAVALIGSAATEPAVSAAVEDFGVPVIPCTMAAFACAAGAASSARMESDRHVEPVEEPHRARGGVALFAAAGVLASGMVVGGGYVLNGFSRPMPTVVADAQRDGAGAEDVSGGLDRTHGAEAEGPFAAPLGSTGAASGSQLSGEHWGDAPESDPLPLSVVETAGHEESDAQDPLMPGTGVPSHRKVGAPNEALLFPGESPPPAAFTPEAADWWDEHLRLMAQWAAQQVMPG